MSFKELAERLMEPLRSPQDVRQFIQAAMVMQKGLEELSMTIGFNEIMRLHAIAVLKEADALCGAQHE